MFVNKKEQCVAIRFDGVDYSVYYVELSAYEDDLILQKALQVERGRTRGTITARSRIAAINKERFLASIKRVEYTEPGADKPKVVKIDAKAYQRLRRGFRDSVLEAVVEPVVAVDEEDKTDFPDSPTPTSTGSP